MEVDLRTLILATSIASVVQAVVLALQYSLNKTYLGIGAWALGSALLAGGIVVGLLRSIDVLELITIVLGNALLLAGGILIYVGALRFFDKEENRVALVAVSSALVLILAFYTYVDNDIRARTVLVSLAIAVIAILSARAFILHKSDANKASAGFLGVLFVAEAGFYAFRGVYSLVVAPSADYFDPTLLQTGAFMVTFILSSLWTYGLIIMVNQRSHAEMVEAKEHFELIFNTSPDATLITRLDDGLIIDANVGFTALTGYSHNESVGRSSLDLNIWQDPTDRQAVTSMLREHGNCDNFVALFRRKDGSEITGMMSARRIDLRGSPHIISITRDITERGRVEQALRTSEARFRAVTHSAHDAIVTADAAGTIVDWNRGAESTFGYSANEAEGRPITLLMPARDRDPHEARMSDRRTGGERAVTGRPVELIGLRKDGSEFPLELSLSEWEVPEGRHYTAIIRDITERKQAEQRALELALEHERMSVLTKFVQDASHEFRTPLSIVQSHLYLLERLDDPTKRRRKLAEIGEQVTGIVHLVDQLAEMTWLDSDVNIKAQPTDLNELVRVVMVKLRVAAEAKRQTLKMELSPGLPLIAADANRLGRALRELTDNAVRFTPAGGSITVRTAVADDSIAVEVLDTGPGIRSDDVRRVFERFYREDLAHTTPGFGLGLPIARAIVERHGGQLEVESQVGAGSVFRIVLPRLVPPQ